MTIRDIIVRVEDGDSVALADTTFDPKTVDVFRLTTGDDLYLVQDESQRWMTLDEGSEEVILFDIIEDAIDPNLDLQTYNGDDFEFSSEGEGALMEDGEEADKMMFRDFEADGQIIRVIEYIVTGEVLSLFGRIIPEDEIQEV
jgi:hypothetical protein